MIHAGASKDFQRWPSENFVSLANRLGKDHRVSWIRQTSNDASGLDSTVQIIDTPAVADLVAVLASARLFIGNNSGPFQIASALGTSSVIINGPSSRCWDPFWFPERIMMLRDESVPCLPCEAYYAECRNPRRMQCMNKWTVGAVETEARLWLDTWSDSSANHLQAATRLQFRGGAILQDSTTPSLRATGFGDEDDDDENEAPGA